MEKLGHEDIILEIILWLPAKSVMRFKCISKAWNSWMEYPNFPKLHLARSQSRPSVTRLLFVELNVELDYRVNYRAKKTRPLEGFSLELTRCFYYEDMFVCSNHCHGLVCLYSSKESQVYLFNVSTREIKALPLSVKHVKYGLDPRLYLGFDMVTGKYKLLHIFREANPRRVIKYRILTLGTNSWRSLVMPRDCFMTPTRHIYLHGFLYAIDTFAYFNFREENFGNLSLIPHCRLSLNMMQTALLGKLVVHCWGLKDDELIYDDLNKVFTKFVDYSNSEKVAYLETEGIDRPTENGNTILATASIMSAPTTLVAPYLFRITSVSSFVDNIIPLTSLF